MNFDVYIPGGILKDFVEYITFLSGPASGTGIAFPRMNQVIIINMGNNFSVSDIYSAASGEKEVRETVWINGKQEHAFMLKNSGTAAMFAIGLKSGMLPYFANLPVMETNDLAVGAENWTSREIFNLREQLMGCPTIRSAYILIEKYFEGLLRQKDFSNLDKITWLSKAIHTSTVEDICRSLGATRQKLRSEAQHYFGGPIKNIQGIIRFNHTLRAIANHEGRSLSCLHDYYDQSHFINDFKTRTGITPLQYKRPCDRFPEIKNTPNFISLQRETFLQFISV